MADEQESTTQDDEVILSARYDGWSWIGGAFMAGVAFLAVYVIYVFPQRGQYFRLVFAVLSALLYFPVATEILFTKEIVFYQDRLEKVWYWLGKRVIPYSRAVARGPAQEFRWLQKGYQIKESGLDGKTPLLQIPISCNARFPDRRTALQVDMIMDYLSGDKESLSSPRRLTKFTLPKEVLCPAQES